VRECLCRQSTGSVECRGWFVCAGSHGCSTSPCGACLDSDHVMSCHSFDEPSSQFSFVISEPHGRWLHWGFVAALLNDLFGIQCRGGCLCAGPYAHDLLSITESESRAIEAALLDKSEVMRPGCVLLVCE
jgi:hypothetical protein